MNPMTRTRKLAVPSMALALAAIGLNAATAQADPPADPGPAASCTYKLTAPSVVNVSGTDMVTSVIAPGPCTGVIQPNSFVVCIEMLGVGTPLCKSSALYEPVQVYFAPYRKGATYKATGRGCGDVFASGGQVCSSLGPYTVTL